MFKNLQILDICVNFRHLLSENTQTHLENLEAVLRRLREAGFTVRPDKCKFLESRVPGTYYKQRRVEKK